MSLIIAKDKEGRIRHASEGEVLRNVELYCPYCGVRVHITKFKRKKGYYFSLQDGEHHEKGKKCYELFGEKEKPSFLPEQTPQSFVEGLMKPEKKMDKKTQNNVSNSSSNSQVQNTNVNSKKDVPNPIKSIPQAIKSGIHRQLALGKTHKDSNNINMDYFVFSPKWASIFWDKKGKLSDLKECVVEVLPQNSKLKKNQRKWKNYIDGKMEKTRIIWFVMYFEDKNTGQDINIRFALECETNSVFKTVLKKIFKVVENENKTQDRYAFKGTDKKCSVLVAGNWRVLSKEECSKICNVRSKKTCEKCPGACISDCSNSKQVYFFDRKKWEEKR